MLPGCGGRKVSMATGGVEGLRRARGGSVAGRPVGAQEELVLCAEGEREGAREFRQQQDAAGDF